MNFAVGEDVLIEHQGKYYEGTVLEVVPVVESSSNEYLVHYKGWSKKWDERVSPDRLMKDNEEGRKLRSGHIQEEKKRARESKLNSDVSFSANHLVKTFGVSSEPRIPLFFPSVFQQYLVHDWIAVECKRKLYSLPVSPSVQQILDDFKHSSFTPAYPPEPIDVVCSSLIAYFDKFINSRLLYASEVLQLKNYLYGEAVDSLSTVFGSIHLLRLLCAS
ncbi:hypothetical protein BLSTO_05377 [Blastocystis sp. subtype 1]